MRKPLTEEQKAKQREAVKRWKQRNKDNPEYIEKRRAGWRAYRERNLEKCREASNRYKRENWSKVYPKHLAYIRQYMAAKYAARPTDARSDEIRVSVLNQNEIYAAAANAVPKTISPWRREDIISDIVLAVLEGAIDVMEIAVKAKDFISEYNRNFSEFMHVEFDEAFMQPSN